MTNLLKLFRCFGTLYHNDKETLIKKRQVETALACSENEPTTSSEISVSPIDNSDPIQFNKRSLSDEDRMKLLQTKWIPPSNSYIFPKNDQNRHLITVGFTNGLNYGWLGLI
jgi:hypothetical protein